MISGESIKKNGALLASAISIFGGSLALTGCSRDNNTPVANAPCRVIDPFGLTQNPINYPQGLVGVTFAAANSKSAPVNTKGLITTDGTNYTLELQGLPKQLSNTLTDFDGTYAAVIINSNQTGEIGFTSGCIRRGTDSYGFETTLVDLPTNNGR